VAHTGQLFSGALLAEGLRARDRSPESSDCVLQTTQCEDYSLDHLVAEQEIKRCCRRTPRYAMIVV